MRSEVSGQKPIVAATDRDQIQAADDGRSPINASRSNRWSYEDAFSRNLGLVTREEQARLRTRRVAIAGLGGVGGVDLVALARLGIGNFTIADPDRFETRNTNRQYGAMSSTEGRYKAEVMRDIVRDINPEADVRVFRDPIGSANAEAFLSDADILVDGIDAFEIDLRRTLFRMARERGIHALGAGPVGFSTVWVIFSPRSMPFDRYFDLDDSMSAVEKFVAYVVGMAPSALQRGYMNLEHLDVENQVGPSAGLACHLASGVVAAEVLKILLERGRIHAAPVYHQFDPYVGRYIRRRLRGGNRNPLQKAKRRWLLRYLARRGVRR